MAVDTGAINTILNAYLQGRGIRERAVAEQTRQRERSEDISRAEQARREDIAGSEEHYKAEKAFQESQFSLQSAIAEMQQRGNILQQYKESEGSLLPPNAKLEQSFYEDQNTGEPLDVPRARDYSYTDLQGKPQSIQLPNPQYIHELELQRAEEAARAQSKIQSQAKGIEELNRYTTESQLKREEHGYKMSEIEATAKGQREARDAAKKDFSPLAEAAVRNPELLDNLSKADYAVVMNDIVKNNSQWTPPVVAGTKSRLNQALAEIDNIKKIPGYYGAAGQVFKNLGGTDTNALNDSLESLKNLLTVDRLGFMRGLGHMSDNDLKVIQGGISKLKISNKYLPQVVDEIERTVRKSLKDLDSRVTSAGNFSDFNVGAPSVNFGALGDDFEKAFPVKK